LDAKSSKYYTGVYKHNKLEGKIKMMSLEEITKLSKEKKLEVYKDYENVNISHHVLLHLNDFKKISNINELEPLYIKDPV
jgi:tRNA A37 threonylcarbamoyladenosine modification protein TsaB